MTSSLYTAKAEQENIIKYKTQKINFTEFYSVAKKSLHLIGTPKFVGSNPAEVDAVFLAQRIKEIYLWNIWIWTIFIPAYSRPNNILVLI